MYSHYLSKACWIGALIIPVQTSPESPLVWSLLFQLFKSQSIEDLKELALTKCNFSEDDFSAFLMYACAVFTNYGNFKSFGDIKFIPNVEQDKFQKLINASQFAALSPNDAKKLLANCCDVVYSLKDGECQLGYPCVGTTTFLSKNVTEEDNALVAGFLKRKGVEIYNSRLFKTTEENGKVCYEVRLASVLDTDDKEKKNLIGSEVENSHEFKITRGDYSNILQLVNKNLLLAKEYAANENQVKMIEKYMESFHDGSVDAHKDGSRFWVKDQGPVVESYIGFIETYRDPAGVRAEFEGFVAMVNKPMSKKYAEIVEAAEEFISLLPWPSSYEKDKFLKPDFTSLDVLAFGSSDIPIGINIPNYDEIRQSEGFKNVTLGNAISVRDTKPPNFLNKKDQEMFMNYRSKALELVTGLHELLGHGSGKNFHKRSDGSFDFDIENVRHLETNEKISTWYEEGDNYNSVFGPLASPMEECRADSVALYLCTVPEVLSIFGYDGDEQQNILYVSWLEVVYSGINSLKMYEPKTESWLQAHSQAAYVILQVLLESEGNFVKVERVTGEDGNPDLLFTMDQSKIISHGKPCLGDFLRKLQLYKSTADAKSAKSLFDKYSVVSSESKYPFLEYREIVMARRRPRRLLVQPNTFLNDGRVELRHYESSPNGLIQSFLERYQDVSFCDTFEQIWNKDKHHFY